LSAFLLAAAVLAAAATGVPAAAAQEAPPAASPSPEASPSPRPRKERIVVRDHRTVRSYPANLGHNVVEVWTRASVRPLLIGAAGAGLAAFLDDNAVSYFERHPHESYGNAGRVMGTGVVVGAASTALFGVGRYANGDRFRAATYDMSQAVVVNFLYTLAIKESVRRERPDKSDRFSFPSGHASNAFACAQVWVEQYGWKAAVPGYLAAGLIAGSRLALAKHYLSDVAAGAALGIIVGKSVARWDAKPSRKPLPGEPPRPRVGLAPATALDGSGLGLGVTVRF